MSHPYLELPGPRVFAHRGLVTAEDAARGIAENTVAAFEAAIAAGADYVETDCHLTRDGKVVLFHDASLERVTGDPRRLSDVTYAELQRLMADRGGLGTLDEVLAAYPQTRFNIDVKAPAAAEAAGRIVGPHANRTLITGFSDAVREATLRSAAQVSALRPATSPGRSRLIRLVLALAVGAVGTATRLLGDLDALQIPEKQGAIPVLTPRLIETAHRSGVEVHVWTINDPARMIDLVSLGADGVVTDRADLGLAALSR